MKTKLPPDPENMNDDRAEWAGAALRHFQCKTGTDYDFALGDLLCDLMHWSDRKDFDFEATLKRARMHYVEETARTGIESETRCAGSQITAVRR